MEKPTLEIWAYKWLHIRVQSRCKPRTLENYTDAVQRLFRCIPEWQEKDMNAITNLEIQAAFNDMGKKYAQSTLNHMRVVLRGTYNMALQNQIVNFNPVSNISIPRYASKKDVRDLSSREQKLVEQAAAEDPLGDITLFFFQTGLRAGELMALRWEDYFETGSISAIRIRNSKTRAGDRIVPLTHEAKEILIRQKRVSEFIFTSTRGPPLTKTVLRKLYVRMREKTGLNFLSNHTYRHAFATRMIEHSADYKALSALMGHTDVAFTLNRYPRVHLEFLTEQMNLISECQIERGRKSGHVSSF